jgi:hypothetical protein
MRFFDFLSLIWSSAIIIGALWFFGFLLTIGIVVGFELDSDAWMGPLLSTFALLGVVGGVFTGYQSTKAEAHCDSCNFDWVVDKDFEDHISESSRTEVVRKHGEGESNTRREVTTERYWQHYKCNKCDALSQVKCSRTSRSAEY